eukprot:571617-Rhodomonas_salina.1
MVRSTQPSEVQIEVSSRSPHEKSERLWACGTTGRVHHAAMKPQRPDQPGELRPGPRPGASCAWRR